MRLGCSNSEKEFTGKLHSPWFDIDEQVLEVGVAIFSEALVRVPWIGNRPALSFDLKALDR